MIKADGLAAGKGVTVAMTREEAEAAIEAAGDGPMVIEEFLEGEEASLFALVDGETAVALASAQDHKRVGEGDTGPNTGGMGAYTPAPVLTPELERAGDGGDRRCRRRGQWRLPERHSRGVLYAGLMLTADGPKLIEYNVRFGDPECEAIMPRIEGDFAELLHAVATGRLADARPALSPQSAVTVIVAASGYPGTPKGGGLIREIEAAEQVAWSDGLPRRHCAIGEGLVAKGGRVLAVTAVADTFANARARAYRAIDQIDFADGFHRRDIGWRELERSRSDEPTDEPSLGPLLAGHRRGRRRRRHRRRVRIPAEEARPLGAGCRAGAILALAGFGTALSAPAAASPTTVERETRQVLVDFEMGQVRAVVQRRPLSRTLVLERTSGRFPARRSSSGS